MHRTNTRCMALTLATLLVGGCGSDGPTGPGGNGGGGGTGMSAKIDGVSWQAVPISLAAIPGQAGLFTLVGTMPDGNSSKNITLTLHSVSATGSFPLGTSFDVRGGRGSYGEMNAIWATETDARSGTVTVTALTSTRIAGTFEFTAAPGRGNASTVNRTITEGRFDLPLSFAPPAMPANAGKTMTATLNGTAWTAPNIVVQPLAGNQLNISTSGGTYSVSLNLAAITGPGTYALGTAAPLRAIIVGGGTGGINSPNCCYGLNASDTGTVTITTLTADRVIGTFSATLGAQPVNQATGTMVITNGKFDLGFRP